MIYDMTRSDRKGSTKRGSRRRGREDEKELS
jgi:hypothetical protein